MNWMKCTAFNYGFHGAYFLVHALITTFYRIVCKIKKAAGDLLDCGVITQCGLAFYFGEAP